MTEDMSQLEFHLINTSPTYSITSLCDTECTESLFPYVQTFRFRFLRKAVFRSFCPSITFRPKFEVMQFRRAIRHAHACCLIICWWVCTNMFKMKNAYNYIYICPVWTLSAFIQGGYKESASTPNDPITRPRLFKQFQFLVNSLISQLVFTYTASVKLSNILFKSQTECHFHSY